MFSVSAEIYNAVSVGSRWLFVFIALLLLLFSFSWLHSLRKEHRSRFKNLPGAGTIGELIVISGSRELPPDTWFPVPREGVLGSVRSCDLVIPCPGVRARHLDFVWQDGVGLLVRPRSGCDALVDGMMVDHRSAGEASPLIHGSFLQIGSALLRLQLFSALDHTNRPVMSPQPEPQAAVYSPVPPAPEMFPAEGAVVPPPVQSFPQYPAPVPPVPPEGAGEPVPVGQAPAQPSDSPESVSAAPSAAPRRRRSDRWKEDWSE